MVIRMSKTFLVNVSFKIALGLCPEYYVHLLRRDVTKGCHQ